MQRVYIDEIRELNRTKRRYKRSCLFVEKRLISMDVEFIIFYGDLSA